MVVRSVPLVIEGVQDFDRSFFIWLLMDLLEFIHDIFAIIYAYFSADIAHDMYQTALKMSFGICFFQYRLHAHNAILKKELNLF